MNGAQLTTTNLVVTDLVGSTRLLSELGHDRYSELRVEHFDALRAVFASYGGVEGAFTGDGILSLLPSTVGALECATALHRVVDSLNRRPGATQLQVRIGVALGDVENDGDTVHGLPVVEAFRLCDKANDSQTLCSEVVARVAADRGFVRLVEFAPMELKGFSGPRIVYELPWNAIVSTLPPRLVPPEGEGRFIGRESELNELLEMADEVRQGQSRLAVLSGEPGIGKTRLATELARHLHVDGVRVLHGRAEPRGSVPLAAIVQALLPVLAEQQHDQLLRELIGGPASVVQRLLVDQKSDGGVGVPAERERLFDAVFGLLAALGSGSPVLLMLDDVQFAGPDTLDLIHQIARRNDLNGVLVVLTVTTGTELDETAVRPLLGRLRRESSVRRLDLVGLSEDEVGLIVSDGGAHPRRIRPELVQYVHARTSGNALYVCEMVSRYLELDVEARGEVGAVPESVRELVAARVAGFDVQCDGVLSIAAVSGTEFDLDLISELDGRTVDELHELIDVAVRGGILVEDAEELDAYRFALPIMRDVLETQMSPGRRTRLHRRIGEVLETRDRTDPAHVYALAYHWAQAGRRGDPERAIRYTRVAGQHALATGTFSAAAEHFRRALHLMPDGGATELHYSLEHGLAESLNGLGDALAARPHYRTAWDIAEEMSDAPRQAAVALAIGAGFNPFGTLSPDPEKARLLRAALEAPARQEDRPRLLVTLATALPLDDPERDDLGREALDEATASGDEELTGWVLSRTHPLNTDPADAAVRQENAQQIIEIGERAGNGELEMIGWSWLAVSALELGDGDLFRRAGDRRRDLAGLLADPVHRWTSAMHASLESACDGRLDDAERESFFAVARGNRVVGEDAIRFCGTQIVSIRRLQGRLVEIVDSQAAFTTANPDYLGAGLMTVFTLASVGRVAQARATLAMLEPPSTLRRDFDFLQGLSWLAMAGVEIGDPELAQWALPQLEPYRGYMCSAADAALFHSVSHAVAVGKRQLGHDDASEWYDIAADEYRRFGADPWLVTLEREWNHGITQTMESE